MKKILIVIGIFFLSILSFSQNKPIDSAVKPFDRTNLTKKIYIEDLSFFLVPNVHVGNTQPAKFYFAMK